MTTSVTNSLERNMRYRQPYSLYRRSDSPVFYYRTYDSAGRRTPGRSTGCTTKTAARHYCDTLLRRGTLVPGSAQTLRDYTVDWWVWGRCTYVAALRSRNQVTKAHVDNQRRLLELHIWPELGGKRIDSLSTAVIEDWTSKLLRGHLSGESVRKCLACLKTILSEAVRRGELSANPALGVRAVPSVPVERGILTIAEARALFDPGSWHWVWREDLKHYTLNVLAAATGLRRGELLAIRPEYVATDSITLPREATKTRKKRIVPISASIHRLILSLADAHGGQYVFPGRRADARLTARQAGIVFYKALRRIGIQEEERQKRNITFHSWRHWCNTYMQSSGVSGGLLRSMTGHSGEEMTAHYSHFAGEHYKQIVAVQERLLSDW